MKTSNNSPSSLSNFLDPFFVSYQSVKCALDQNSSALSLGCDDLMGLLNYKVDEESLADLAIKGGKLSVFIALLKTNLDSTRKLAPLSFDNHVASLLEIVYCYGNKESLMTLMTLFSYEDLSSPWCFFSSPASPLTTVIVLKNILNRYNDVEKASKNSLPTVSTYQEKSFQCLMPYLTRHASLIERDIDASLFTLKLLSKYVKKLCLDEQSYYVSASMQAYLQQARPKVYFEQRKFFSLIQEDIANAFPKNRYTFVNEYQIYSWFIDGALLKDDIPILLLEYHGTGHDLKNRGKSADKYVPLEKDLKRDAYISHRYPHIPLLTYNIKNKEQTPQQFTQEVLTTIKLIEEKQESLSNASTSTALPSPSEESSSELEADLSKSTQKDLILFIRKQLTADPANTSYLELEQAYLQTYFLMLEMKVRMHLSSSIELKELSDQFDFLAAYFDLYSPPRFDFIQFKTLCYCYMLNAKLEQFTLTQTDIKNALAILDKIRKDRTPEITFYLFEEKWIFQLEKFLLKQLAPSLLCHPHIAKTSFEEMILSRFDLQNLAYETTITIQFEDKLNFIFDVLMQEIHANTHQSMFWYLLSSTEQEELTGYAEEILPQYLHACLEESSKEKLMDELFSLVYPHLDLYIQHNRISTLLKQWAEHHHLNCIVEEEGTQHSFLVFSNESTIVKLPLPINKEETALPIPILIEREQTTSTSSSNSSNSSNSNNPEKLEKNKINYELELRKIITCLADDERPYCLLGDVKNIIDTILDDLCQIESEILKKMDTYNDIKKSLAQKKIGGNTPGGTKKDLTSLQADITSLNQRLSSYQACEAFIQNTQSTTLPDLLKTKLLTNINEKRKQENEEIHRQLTYQNLLKFHESKIHAIFLQTISISIKGINGLSDLNFQVSPSCPSLPFDFFNEVSLLFKKYPKKFNEFFPSISIYLINLLIKEKNSSSLIRENEIIKWTPLVLSGLKIESQESTSSVILIKALLSHFPPYAMLNLAEDFYIGGNKHIKLLIQYAVEHKEYIFSIQEILKHTQSVKKKNPTLSFEADQLLLRYFEHTLTLFLDEFDAQQSDAHQHFLSMLFNMRIEDLDSENKTLISGFRFIAHYMPLHLIEIVRKIASAQQIQSIEILFQALFKEGDPGFADVLTYCERTLSSLVDCLDPLTNPSLSAIIKPEEPTTSLIYFMEKILGSLQPVYPTTYKLALLMSFSSRFNKTTLFIFLAENHPTLLALFFNDHNSQLLPSILNHFTQYPGNLGLIPDDILVAFMEKIENEQEEASVFIKIVLAYPPNIKKVILLILREEKYNSILRHASNEQMLSLFMLFSSPNDEDYQRFFRKIISNTQTTFLLPILSSFRQFHMKQTSSIINCILQDPDAYFMMLTKCASKDILVIILERLLIRSQYGLSKDILGDFFIKFFPFLSKKISTALDDEQKEHINNLLNWLYSKNSADCFYFMILSQQFPDHFYEFLTAILETDNIEWKKIVFSSLQNDTTIIKQIMDPSGYRLCLMPENTPPSSLERKIIYIQKTELTETQLWTELTSPLISFNLKRSRTHNKGSYLQCTIVVSTENKIYSILIPEDGHQGDIVTCYPSIPVLAQTSTPLNQEDLLLLQNYTDQIVIALFGYPDCPTIHIVDDDHYHDKKNLTPTSDNMSKLATFYGREIGAALGIPLRTCYIQHEEEDHHHKQTSLSQSELSVTKCHFFLSPKEFSMHLCAIKKLLSPTQHYLVDNMNALFLDDLNGHKLSAEKVYDDLTDAISQIIPKTPNERDCLKETFELLSYNKDLIINIPPHSPSETLANLHHLTSLYRSVIVAIPDDPDAIQKLVFSALTKAVAPVWQLSPHPLFTQPPFHRLVIQSERLISLQPYMAILFNILIKNTSLALRLLGSDDLTIFDDLYRAVIKTKNLHLLALACQFFGESQVFPHYLTHLKQAHDEVSSKQISLAWLQEIKENPLPQLRNIAERTPKQLIEHVTTLCDFHPNFLPAFFNLLPTTYENTPFYLLLAREKPRALAYLINHFDQDPNSLQENAKIILTLFLHSNGLIFIESVKEIPKTLTCFIKKIADRQDLLTELLFRCLLLSCEQDVIKSVFSTHERYLIKPLEHIGSLDPNWIGYQEHYHLNETTWLVFVGHIRLVLELFLFNKSNTPFLFSHTMSIQIKEHLNTFISTILNRDLVTSIDSWTTSNWPGSCSTFITHQIFKLLPKIHHHNNEQESAFTHLLDHHPDILSLLINSLKNKRLYFIEQVQIMLDQLLSTNRQGDLNLKVVARRIPNALKDFMAILFEIEESRNNPVSKLSSAFTLLTRILSEDDGEKQENALDSQQSSALTQLGLFNCHATTSTRDCHI